jgi:hypothetical protein
MKKSIALLVLSLTACQQGDRVPYYADIDSVSISGFAGDAFEPGNIGGYEVTITGAGFGDDVAQVTVQFASLNAEVLTVSNDSITVVSPKGPITGGLVDLRIATAIGQAELLDAYDYEVPSVTDDQAGYIVINDFWRAVDDPEFRNIPPYFGEAGLDAELEWYDFAFPRAHSGSYGFGGGTDWSPGEWSVQIPSYRPFVQAVDGLRKPLPSDFALTNANNSGTTCVEIDEAGYFDGADCNDPDNRIYDHQRLEFCEIQSLEGRTSQYGIDWPVEQPFFAGLGETDSEEPYQRRVSCTNGFDDDGDGLVDGQDPKCHPEIGIDAVGIGFADDDLVLRFPEPLQYTYTGDGSLAGPGLSSCATTEEGAVFVFEWMPTEVEYTLHEKVVAADSHVRVTISTWFAGWFGTESFPIQATITVPDVFDVDPETGTSMLIFPVDIANQFPSFRNALFPACTAGSCNYRSVEDANGFFVVSASRVTEYRLNSPAHPYNTGGDLVIAYVSGGFGIGQDAEFQPAIQGGTCSNCVDDDLDGWVDSLDADCILAEEGEGVENGELDGAGCSDGIDNDGNGLIDAEDRENCEDGVDGETNCGNGEDDDGDGWVDELDGECVDDNSAELGEDDPAWLCSDGIDNDSDGWIDIEDPACVDGSGLDEGGFSGSACNDGIDNDGHMDTDSEDYYCFLNGAAAEREDPDTFESNCDDGKDNESTGQTDNFWDAFDPACEKSPYFSEGSKGWKTTDPITTECYDTVDNDGDGLTDAADPSCWNPDFGHEPDGFLNDESAVWGTECDNGLDDDSDGLVDGLDPDCQPRYEAFQYEMMVGATQCNDGADNDGDLLVDSVDLDCENAADDSE